MVASDDAGEHERVVHEVVALQLESATGGSGSRSSTMNGQKKLFHACMNVNSPSIAAAAGRPDADGPEGAELAAPVDARGLDQLVGHGLDEVLPHPEDAERA